MEEQYPFTCVLDSNWAWSNEDPEWIMMFLKTQQNYVNDILRYCGTVTLKRVYELLGLEYNGPKHLGWRMDSEFGDHYVDFGLLKYHPSLGMEYEDENGLYIILDFNTD